MNGEKHMDTDDLRAAPGKLACLKACAARHLDEYTDPASDYAFWTYDRRGDANVLTPVDCLAPALLSVQIRAKSVRALFMPTGSGRTCPGSRASR